MTQDESSGHYSRPHLHLTTFLVVMVFAALPLAAQSFYGAIRGTVLDPNGAGVANAKVTRVDESTGASRATESTTPVEYVFSEVVPSTYSVSAETSGFKKFEQHGVIVATQQQITLPLTLPLG